MIGEFGQLALILALLCALLQGGAPLLAPHAARWQEIAARAALAQTLCVALAFAALLAAFARNDFSVAYVVAHSNSRLPLQYRLAGLWGGHEGSLLLWAAILALWTGAVLRGGRALPAALRARVLGVLGLVAAGFLAFLLFTSNPFARTLPAAPDGRDLNPLLQDAGMIFHPPLLYMGYVGFAVAFAFAVAALLEGRFDAAWARWVRPWTLAAWAFLTGGILLGSFWAYYELGWGGWWFWDAVENASFMPWLVGTALVHSLAVADQRGRLRGWALLLAIAAFGLSLLGTFLVRSGVLSSVHAFASDPRRGLVILGLLVVAIGGALALYAWRAPAIAAAEAAEEGAGSDLAWLSRETLLLVNNLLLVVAAATVLLGTLYPLAVDAFGGGRISVGAPYFDAVFVPLMLPLMALLGLGPLARWQRSQGDGPRELLARARWPLGLAAAMALLVGAAALSSPLAATGVALGLWVICATAAHAAPWRQRWRQVTGAQAGMWLAHAGLGVFVLGVSLVKHLEQSREGSLAPGQSLALGAYEFRFESLERRDGPNYEAAAARFIVREHGAVIARLAPEKRYYPVQQMPMTEAAIDRGFTRDLYVSLADAVPGGAWGVRVQVKPFMGWIWTGALLMAAGGALAAADRRYRRRAAAVAVGALAGARA